VIKVWAPDASQVALRVDAADIPLAAAADGWWTGPDLPPGTDYAFVLDGSDPLPDPASRWQPHGVHGPSRVYDQAAFLWSDGSWHGRSLEGGIVYELHVGTFTPTGTLDSAVERLDHLVDLGVTHVELLPLNSFNGDWNWGYDGVDWYAVSETYGGPDALKRFVDAAHARGLAVVLDVVYNHLGPSGNYLPRFGPYLRHGRNTWGDLVNFAEPAVRSFVIENALMWLRDFHVDALRLDAIHALQDDSPVHVLRELSDAVREFEASTGRTMTLIGESDLNDAQTVLGEWGLDAQWDDDVHHALHVNLTGETQGYYADFEGTDVLAKVWTKAFLHDGTFSSFRGRDHGRPISPDTPAWRFVVCLQNHDQVGNRAVGDRLPELTSPGLLRVGAVLLLTSPFTPMLWMGEEWGASTRWPFFTAHPEPELAKATGEGRIAEFADHGWDVSAMIDPQDPRAFHEAKLRWDEVADPAHYDLLWLYRHLIKLRAAEPDLRDGDLRRVRVEHTDTTLTITRGAFTVLANLGESPASFDVSGDIVLETAAVTRTGTGGLSLPPESAAIVRT
jgi:maltooligosyltrehalose trehalohydrolase